MPPRVSLLFHDIIISIQSHNIVILTRILLPTLSALPEVQDEITPTTATNYPTNSGDPQLNAAHHANDKNLTTRSNAKDPDNGAVSFTLTFARAYFVHNIIIHQIFKENACFADDDCVTTAWVECKNNHDNVNIAVYKGNAMMKSCGILKVII